MEGTPLTSGGKGNRRYRAAGNPVLVALYPDGHTAGRNGGFHDQESQVRAQYYANTDAQCNRPEHIVTSLVIVEVLKCIVPHVPVGTQWDFWAIRSNRIGRCPLQKRVIGGVRARRLDIVEAL
jgi:hypothetical protein